MLFWEWCFWFRRRFGFIFHIHNANVNERPLTQTLLEVSPAFKAEDAANRAEQNNIEIWNLGDLWKRALTRSKILAKTRRLFIFYLLYFLNADGHLWKSCRSERVDLWIERRQLACLIWSPHSLRVELAPNNQDGAKRIDKLRRTKNKVAKIWIWMICET